MTSTKFWSNVCAMICTTVVMCWLVHLQQYEYILYYFGAMGTFAGGYTATKTLQNLLIKPKDNGEVK